MNSAMNTWVRRLHVYAGLFLSPFAVIYALSVLFLVHVWLPGKQSAPAQTRVVTDLGLPDDLEQRSGRALIDVLQPIFHQAGIQGEAGWVQHLPKERRFVIPLSVPGKTVTVTLDVAKKEATVESRETGFADATIALHKFPGPHLVQLRKNWWPMQIWAWLADGTVLLMSFTLTTGLLWWWLLRTDRRPGLWLLGAGAITFLGMIYALVF